MTKAMIYEEFSEDANYKFEIYEKADAYEIWVKKKITDEYMGADWFDYHTVSDYMHYADTFERAVAIGKECLRCMG